MEYRMRLRKWFALLHCDGCSAQMLVGRCWCLWMLLASFLLCTSRLVKVSSVSPGEESSAAALGRSSTRLAESSSGAGEEGRKVEELERLRPLDAPESNVRTSVKIRLPLSFLAFFFHLTRVPC